MDTQSEETPLLSSKHDALYQRFTPAEKRNLVAMVSVCGLLPCVYYAHNYQQVFQRIMFPSFLSFRIWNIYTLYPSDRKRSRYNRSYRQVSCQRNSILI